MTTWTGRTSAPPGVVVEASSAATGAASSSNSVLDPTGSAPGAPVTPRRLPTPLRPSDFGRKDVLMLAVAAASALAMVWIVFYQLALLSGLFGFIVCWYAVFLTFLWVGTAQVVERQAATDRVAATVVVSAGLLLIGIVIFIVAWVAYKAIPSIHWSALFTKDQKQLSVLDPNVFNEVGVLHAVIGTLEQVAISAAIGVPIAIATAVFLNEVGGRGVRTVRTVVTAMSGTPSIIAGVFIYSIFIVDHLLSFSGFAASLALVVILLPSVTRVIEEVLRVVPGGLREAAFALGAPQWRTVWSVVLPTARSGVVTGILLGIARIVGETAPLIWTEFGSNLVNANPFAHPQGSLPLTIYSGARQAPQPVYVAIAYQAAFVLMAVVLVLFVLARVLGRTKGKKFRLEETPEEDAFARMIVPVPIERTDSAAWEQT